jgi:hypothetical protein
MHFLMTPLQTHFDLGFGAVADSFKDAADLVSDPEAKSSSLHFHLPASFLYRHAIELFFKSGIIIFHRKFNIPWGEGNSSEPQIPIAGKWKPMYSVHKLAPLHERLVALMHEHSDYLKTMTRTNWTLPEELPHWIMAIDDTDSSSTFFRYPVTKHSDKDEAKSRMKSEDMASILARMKQGAEPQKVLLVLDGNENVQSSYRMDQTQSLEILNILRSTADFMFGCHAAMRGELTGGW